MYASAELVVPKSMPTFIYSTSILFNFNLCGSDHVAGRERRQLDLIGAPSFVTQRAAGGFAAGGNIADELHAVGVSFREGAFDAVDHGGELEITLHRLARVFLHVAHGGSDLLIGVGGNIFHQKIDQARVALKDGKNLDGSIGRTGLRFRRRGGAHRHHLGIAERLRDVGRQIASEEDGEESSKSERYAAQIYLKLSVYLPG